MTGDPFAPIGRATPTTATRKSEWAPVLPVPDDAPPPPAEHFKLGKPTATWRYTDAAGAVLGYVLRFDTTDGEKVFRPLIYARPAAGGKAAWRWESWPPKRPLYGLQGLARRPIAAVVVCEGEKAADAAAMLLASYVTVTSPNGSKGAGKTDWSPLRGRAVTIWPDADTAGLEYAHAVAKHALRAGAVSVAIVAPPDGVKVGWDAADALAEGWSGELAGKLVTSADPFEQKAGAAKGGSEDDASGDPGGVRRRTPQRDILIGLTEFVELWHDADRIAYASFAVNHHRENWPVRSRDFRMWLSGQFYEKTGSAIGGQALEDGLRILEARAVNEGPLHECFMRTGHAGENLYLDLGDPTWRAVEITTTGWGVIEKPPLKFLRSPSMRPLPLPEEGTLIESLRRFVNVKTDADFMLVVAFIVAALRDRGPYPILVLNGEAGVGKSLCERILRSLIDPSAAPIRAMPRDDRDLVVSASNSWVLAFDNLSKMEAWQADALCRLATGSGFATRMLHTDRDEMIFEAARPIIINGIPTLTDRADLADRAVTINLRELPEDQRRPEDEFLAEFEQARPHILGALLGAVSRAHGRIDSIKLDRLPRMADFAKWITAAEPGLGWEPGEFIAAYSENRRDVSETTFEADNVALAIWKLISAGAGDGFEGTATELLEAINPLVSDQARKSKYWPQTPAMLGNRVARAAPLLKAKGCAVERRHSGARVITIKPPRDEFS